MLLILNKYFSMLIGFDYATSIAFTFLVSIQQDFSGKKFRFPSFFRMESPEGITTWEIRGEDPFKTSRTWPYNLVEVLFYLATVSVNKR